MKTKRLLFFRAEEKKINLILARNKESEEVKWDLLFILEDLYLLVFNEDNIFQFNFILILLSHKPLILLIILILILYSNNNNKMNNLTNY